MIIRRMLIAVAIAAAGVSVPQGAAAQHSRGPAPEAGAPQGDQRDVVAIVLGTRVTRGDLAAAADARRAGFLPETPGWSVTWQKREEALVRLAMYDAIFMPLVEDEARARGLEPTADELLNYQTRVERSREQLRRTLRPQPDPDQVAVWREGLLAQVADVEVIEEVKHGYRAELRNHEANVNQQGVSPAPVKKPTPEADRVTRQMVTFLKLHSWLFEQHGGSAAWSPLLFALIAPDAIRSWLAEREEAGDLKFSDPADRDAFLAVVNGSLDGSRGGPLLEGDEAKALLARTPGWAPLEPEALRPSPQPAEPAVPAALPADPNKVLAEVLGVAITRSQIDPIQALAWVGSEKEMKPGGSRDRAALVGLLLMPLLEHEARRNGFAPTDAELRRFHAAVRARDIEMLDHRIFTHEQSLPALRTDAQSPDLDAEARRLSMEFVQQTEQMIEEIKTRKAAIQAERLEALDPTLREAWRALLLRSKAHRWLFGQHGGTVALGPYGSLYAVDALDQWLAEQERTGRLRFKNDRLKEAFYAEVAARRTRAMPHEDFGITGDAAVQLARQKALWE